MYTRMTEYYEAYEQVMGFDGFYMELSREDAGVLSGLIKQHRPRKVVEIGVAGGGSTALIMKTLELLGENETEVISVDLSEKLYRDNEKATGYVFTLNKSNIANYNKHRFLLGKAAYDRIEEIGDDIDLLFLDTVHRIPGEILDFILLYPHLSKNAIVVLHDTNMHNSVHNRDCYCNRVLINSITGNKFYTPDIKYLNVGAVQINEDTGKYIDDVFTSLVLPWNYYNSYEADRYRQEYLKTYSQNLVDIYDSAIAACKYHKVRTVVEDLTGLIGCEDKKVLIYGCGVYGRKVKEVLESESFEIAGYIVSDGIDICKLDSFDVPVYNYSDIPYKNDECVLVVAATYKEIYELLDGSEYEYLDLKNLHTYILK